MGANILCSNFMVAVSSRITSGFSKRRQAWGFNTGGFGRTAHWIHGREGRGPVGSGVRNLPA